MLEGEHMSKRQITFLVAAHDASQLVKDVADYICSGDDDSTVIKAAQEQAELVGGRIVLSEGSFDLVDGDATIGQRTQKRAVSRLFPCKLCGAMSTTKYCTLDHAIEDRKEILT